MMYRPQQDNVEKSRRRTHGRGRRQRSTLPLWLLLASAVVVVYSFVSARKVDSYASVERVIRSDDAVVSGDHSDDPDKVYRRRLDRSAIPELNYRSITYRELFNDSNYVQLSAARANGIDPESVGDPDDCSMLTPIFTTRLYKVDTMYHSVPYLVPEAVLLLDYIAHRFHQLMEAHYPEIGVHKVIVTSALRTEQSERNLRRVNRNATDTSAHIYGTTFDLSAQRYEHVESGHDTVVDACKQMLAMALYELRYEGLCYVKYERGSCFHITLRTTQYEGDAASEMRSYVNPGSPDYLLTKAPPRPKPRVVKQETQKNVASNKTKKTSKKSSVKGKTVRERQGRKSNEKKRESAAAEREKKPAAINHAISERERLSLEEYERRY